MPRDGGEFGVVNCDLCASVWATCIVLNQSLVATSVMTRSACAKISGALVVSPADRPRHVFADGAGRDLSQERKPLDVDLGWLGRSRLVLPQPAAQRAVSVPIARIEACAEQRDADDDDQYDDQREPVGGWSMIGSRHQIPRMGSIPTVRPGLVLTARTASTPGMKDTRSSESCRMVKVSPSAPKSTS